MVGVQPEPLVPRAVHKILQVPCTSFLSKQYDSALNFNHKTPTNSVGRVIGRQHGFRFNKIYESPLASTTFPIRRHFEWKQSMLWGGEALCRMKSHILDGGGGGFETEIQLECDVVLADPR